MKVTRSTISKLALAVAGGVILTQSCLVAGPVNYMADKISDYQIRRNEETYRESIARQELISQAFIQNGVPAYFLKQNRVFTSLLSR